VLGFSPAPYVDVGRMFVLKIFSAFFSLLPFLPVGELISSSEEWCLSPPFGEDLSFSSSLAVFRSLSSV